MDELACISGAMLGNYIRNAGFLMNGMSEDAGMIHAMGVQNIRFAVLGDIAGKQLFADTHPAIAVDAHAGKEIHGLVNKGRHILLYILAKAVLGGKKCVRPAAHRAKLRCDHAHGEAGALQGLRLLAEKNAVNIVRGFGIPRGQNQYMHGCWLI